MAAGLCERALTWARAFAFTQMQLPFIWGLFKTALTGLFWGNKTAKTTKSSLMWMSFYSITSQLWGGGGGIWARERWRNFMKGMGTTAGFSFNHPIAPASAFSPPVLLETWRALMSAANYGAQLFGETFQMNIIFKVSWCNTHSVITGWFCLYHKASPYVQNA